MVRWGWGGVEEGEVEEGEVGEDMLWYWVQRDPVERLFKCSRIAITGDFG